MNQTRKGERVQTWKPSTNRLLLLISLVILISCILFSGSFVANTSKRSSESKSYTISHSDSLLQISFMHETSLIPGNKIYFNYGNEWTHLIIKSVRFPRGSEVEFSMNDGKRTKGTLRKELVLSDNWNKSPDSITLRSGKKTEFLPLSKVVSAKGLQNLQQYQSSGIVCTKSW